MTRILLVWPEPIAHFTRSDSYRQVPYHLALRSTVVLLGCEPEPLPPELTGGFESVYSLPRARGAFISAAVNIARAQHAEQPFDAVVTAFDARSLASGVRITNSVPVPWLAVCEDYPFGERYRDADRNVLLRVQRYLHTLSVRRWIEMSDGVAMFINPGVLDFLDPPKDKLLTLGNGVDIAFVDECVPTPPAERTNTIGYVGYVNEDKGALLMAEALAIVRREVPDARLSLIGPCEDATRARMEAIAPGGIEFVGSLPHEESLRRLAACALCWHAYRPHAWLYHNQVLKLLEYMALRRAIVSVATPGTCDLMRDGTDGLLVPCDDPGAMARATVELLRDPPRRAAMGAAGRERVTSSFDWARIGETFAEMVLRGARRE